MQREIAQIFQEASGRVIALLYSHIGDFELVEDAVQDAFVQALEHWPLEGIPQNPTAWILVVARRKAIDLLRRDKTYANKLAILKALTELTQKDNPMDIDEIPDERLKLIFTCCHPALAKEAQIALTLQTLGGLTTQEIATAFLVPVPTMAQRLVRAKRKIRLAGIPYIVPALDALPSRLDAVLSVLYLIFNAGYTAPIGDQLIRPDLCAEATRLTRILMTRLEQEAVSYRAEVIGLLALMLMHDARSPARVSDTGGLVPLEEQDRRLWNRSKIEEGQSLLERALTMRQAGPYQLQAAISALHVQAERPEDTDWAQIAVLYGLLYRMTPSPVIELNRAVAVAMADEPSSGLRLLDDLKLDHYYLYHAARADLLRRAGNYSAAHNAYIRAAELCQNDIERAFLQRRLDEIQSQL